MQRLFGFAPNKSANEQVFIGTTDTSGSNNVRGRLWYKPRGCSMVYFFLQGGGGPGGSGRLDAAGTNRFGGGGGGSSGIALLLLPAWAVPDQLWVVAGDGGPGGDPQTVNSTSGNPGSLSGASYLYYPTQGGSQAFVTCSPGVGGTGGTSAAGTAGVGGSPALNAYWMDQLAITKTINGATGSGGSSGAGLAVSQQTFFGQGAGGGGVTNVNTHSAGGTITNLNAIAGLSVFPRLINGGAAGGGHGESGLSFRGGPHLQTGGAGGGGNDATDGGDGGNGGIGCGGGGGGGATNGGQSGRGGRGGPGMVAITAW